VVSLSLALGVRIKKLIESKRSTRLTPNLHAGLARVSVAFRMRRAEATSGRVATTCTPRAAAG
jgi:hypothetical protein